MKAKLENILFIDIETVPLVYNYKDLDERGKALWDKKWQYTKDVTPDKHYEKAGIFAEFAKIVCIGLGFYNRKKFRIKSLASSNEKEILEQFAELLSEHFSSAEHVLCAHNGKEFDFPFLCRRFLANNMPLPAILKIQGLKPWEVKHIDTLDLWKFGDVKNFTSLDLLAYVLGIPSPKDELDGSKVAYTFYEQKDLKKIENYCKKDVITLARVYQRFAGLGELHDDDIIFV